MKIDVYAFSIIMFEMMVRKPVWSEIKFSYKIGKKVMKGERPSFCKPKSGVPDSPPYDYVTLMTRCWKENPEDRPTFMEISKITRLWCLNFSDHVNNKEEGEEKKANDKTLAGVV